MGIAVPFVDILIFAIIAVFLVLRLRNILGTRDGYEQKPDEMYRTKAAPEVQANDQGTAPDNIVPLRPEALSGSDLAAIKKADPTFQEDQFLQGAASAFQMVLHAYAEGDLSQLRRLLGYDLFNEFSEAIRQRNADNETLSLTIDQINDVQLLDGELVDGIASVTVRFASQQSRHIFDGAGNEIMDDAADKESIIDVWTFERDTQIADPNWKLVETSSEGGDDD